MKPIIATITGLLITTALVAPAQAQRRSCIVSEIDNSVVCGRRATSREIDRYDRRYRRHDRDRNYRRDRDSRSTRNREVVYREIDELYREVLGRRSDRRGLRTYADRILSRDWNLSEVRRELARSQEARDRINQLYRAILRRDADRDGIRTYQRNLERGWSLERVRRDIINSDEARERGYRRR